MMFSLNGCYKPLINTNRRHFSATRLLKYSTKSKTLQVRCQVDDQDHQKKPKIEQNEEIEQIYTEPQLSFENIGFQREDPKGVYDTLSKAFEVEGDVTIDWSPHGWGLIAKKDFKEGDTIVKIPLKNTILTVEQVELTEEGQEQYLEQFKQTYNLEIPEELGKFVCDGDFSTLSRMVAQVMWLLSLDNPLLNSYFGSWPDAKDCASIWSCTREDFESFEEPELIKFISDRRNDVVVMYGQFSEVGFAQDFSAEQFLHYVHMCQSRSLLVKYNDVPAHVLAPVLDFANHSNYPNAEVLQQDSQSIMIVAQGDIEEGAEIFIQYGDLNNEDLIYRYGFIVPQNKYNRLETKVCKAVLSGDIFGDVMKVGGSFNGADLEIIINEGSCLYANSLGEIDRAIAAINSLPFVQFRRLVQTQPTSRAYSKEFQAALEISAYLQKYWTDTYIDDLPSDIELFESEKAMNLSPNQLLGLLYRIEQKQLILDIMAVLMLYVQQLSERDTQLMQLIQFMGTEMSKAVGIEREATEEEMAAFLSEKDPKKMAELEQEAYEKGIMTAFPLE